MKKKFHKIILIFVIVGTGVNCTAQDDNRALLRQVVKENQEAVDAIAMYPTDTRKIIFEVSEYPEAIAKLNGMQKNSEDAFDNLISSLSKDEQEKIWDLTRYDGLISDLVSARSEDQVNEALANYPEEIHQTAIDERNNNYGLLVQIDKMNNGFNSDFELMIKDYPPDVADAFSEIVKMPEVLSILFEHMQYTVVIGDYYKKNPERVLHKTDSLNLVLTQRNKQEADDWKQSINDDPQVQGEFVEAAQEYARDNGGDPSEDYTPQAQDVTNYTTVPYNWWFGYPSWYSYDYWNPYPFWYDWGFYYGRNRQVVFFGLPSAYFMNWYFNHPEHCDKYAELSNLYYNYNTGHPKSMNNNSICYTVNNWQKKNNAILAEGFNKGDADRIQWFKEYGKMEMDREKYNSKNPEAHIEQTEFIRKEHTKYPLLSSTVDKKQPIQNNIQTKPVMENSNEPANKPIVSTTGKDRVEPRPNSNNAEQRPVLSSSPEKSHNTDRKIENINQMRNAREYHQNTWQQIQPQHQQQSQQQSQPQRQQQTYSPPARQQENRQVEQPQHSVQVPSNNRRK